MDILIKWGNKLVVLVMLFLLSACAVGGSLSEEVKNEIYSRYGNDVKIEVMGKGKVLPFEKDFGIEEVICYRVRWNNGGNGFDMIESMVATRVGNNWDSGWITPYDEEWLNHSCPGEFINNTLP